MNWPCNFQYLLIVTIDDMKNEIYTINGCNLFIAKPR